MDYKTLQVLKNAQLEQYIPAFIDQEIRFESLSQLTVSDMLPIFNNKLGPAGTFFAHLKKYLESGALTEEVPTIQPVFLELVKVEESPLNQQDCIFLEANDPVTVDQQDPLSPSVSHVQEQDPKEQDVVFLDQEETNDVNTVTVASVNGSPLTAHSNQKRPSDNLTPGQPQKRIATEDIILHEILSKNVIGRGILQLSKQQSKLSQACRTKLCHEIIVGELGGDPNKTLRKERFEELTQAIRQLFPQELPSTYYIPRKPSTTDIPAVAPKGMLYDKYHNLLKFLRLAGIRESNTNRYDDDEPLPLDDTFEEALNWLESYSASDQITAQGNWNVTREHRLAELQKVTKKRTGNVLAEYWQKYNFITKTWGLTLYLSDFDPLYPNHFPFIRNWRNVQKKLRHVLQNVKSAKVDEVADDDFIKFFRLIPHLFIQASLVGKKPRKSRTCPDPRQPIWKPNKTDSQNGFLLHVKDQRELDSHVQRVKRECKRVGRGLQPFPAVIGDKPEHQTSVIWINDEQFSVENPLVAVDQCFKLYHVLQAEYPCQASYSWLFLQQAVYRILTKWDFDAPKVQRIVHEYNNLP